MSGSCAGIPGVGLLLAVLLVAGAAVADPWTESAKGSDFSSPVTGAVGGAVVGGIIGGVIAGGNGAAVGALVGGTAGAVAGSEQQRIAKEQMRQAEYGERAQWERDRRRQQQQLQQQRDVVWLNAGVGDDYSAAQQAVVAPVPSAPGAVARAEHARDMPADVDPTLLVETQRALIRLGFDPGDVGTLNRQTVATIKVYQVQHNLLETGQPSQALLKHMIRNGG